MKRTNEKKEKERHWSSSRAFTTLACAFALKLSKPLSFNFSSDLKTVTMHPIHFLCFKNRAKRRLPLVLSYIVNMISVIV
eukprot:SAG31_NODE_3480_length_4223_cov_23.570078_3_plen_80_part_00